MEFFCLRNGVSHYDAQTGFHCVLTVTSGKVKSVALEGCEFALRVSGHHRQGGSSDQGGETSPHTSAEKYSVPCRKFPTMGLIGKKCFSVVEDGT